MNNGFSINRNDLLNSLQLIRHRGPDDAGIYQDIEKGIGLAHSRLSIIDLSEQGHQPMSINYGGKVLIYNGEIYNYKSIREDLSRRGHSFRSNSDTEVLLRLFEEHSGSKTHWSSILSSLNGIFALAVWDPKTQELRIARDGMGVKPLYYSAFENLFAFASEIKALFPLVPGLTSIDHASIARYLTYLWCPGEGTPLKHVRKLSPGEALTIKHGNIVERIKWYDLDNEKLIYSSKSNFKNTNKPSDWINGVRNHLKDAVQRQMVSDVPVGAFLSGGLDSSSIVSFARELNPDIRCFTIQATDWDLDEVTDDLPYALRVARHLNVPLEIVPVDSSKMALDFMEMVVRLDEPLADPASLNVLYISQLARESGIKVLLSGAGGDDIFTGYRRHRALNYERIWTDWPLKIRQSLSMFSSILGNRSVLERRLKKMFRGAALNADQRLLDYFKWIDSETLMSLFTVEIREFIVRDKTEQPLLDFLENNPGNLSPIDRILKLEQRFFLADHNLIYTDKMSMAAGVEVRVPFLDLEFVKYVAEIPWYLKQNGSEGKWILKKAMEPILPKSVIYRRKSGFGAPLRRWIRYELNEMIGDILSESSLKKRGFFEPLAVKQLIRENETGKIDASYTILSLLLVELWCRHFLDGQKLMK